MCEMAAAAISRAPRRIIKLVQSGRIATSASVRQQRGAAMTCLDGAWFFVQRICSSRNGHVVTTAVLGKSSPTAQTVIQADLQPKH